MAFENGRAAEAGARVALGMSGGVDSAVAAVLLQRAGYEVMGVTCRFMDGEGAVAAEADAAAVCAKLGIPHTVHDCTCAFERLVVAPFTADYAAGLTPSPCVGCNAHVKLPELAAAADALGCEYIATGHYARVVKQTDAREEGVAASSAAAGTLQYSVPQSEDCLSKRPSSFRAYGRYAIATAADDRKDQSYMLATVGQDLLARLVLPLGELTKSQVREIAAELGLPVASKSDSMDICFAADGYRALLDERGYACEPGEIVNSAGQVIGTHQGLWNYTIGQRKGIGLAAPEPYYVIGKRAAENQLVVGFAEEAMIQRVRVEEMVWQLGVPEAASGGASGEAVPSQEMPLKTKLRYKNRPEPCTMFSEENGVSVRLNRAVPATAPGQFAVLYVDGTVSGDYGFTCGFAVDMQDGCADAGESGAPAGARASAVVGGGVIKEVG